MKRLNAKQLLVLPKGKYHDGNGLYISISSKGKGKWSFRSTFRTWAEEQGKYQHYAIKFSQAQQLPDKVEKAYMRSNLLEQRKIIMNDWEQYILS